MNYLHQPNLLIQFWAGVNNEFDKILDTFVQGQGWLFQDLGVVAKKANIGSIYRCVATSINSNQGKEERLDHFSRVNYVILDGAKTQWLAPWRTHVVDPSKGVIPPFLKRQVGGFFLLYMMYLKQPLPDWFRRKQRILMDSRDLLAMHVFNETIQRLPKSEEFKELGKQVVVLFNDLVVSEAFEFSVYNDKFITPSHSIRNLLGAKFCNFTKTIYTLKDIRDQLYCITYQESSKTFQALVEYGRLVKTEDKEVDKDKNGAKKEATFRPFDKPWNMEEIKELGDEVDVGKVAHGLTSILKSLDLGPILTKERMTGVPENILGKELDNCVQSYKGHRNLQDKFKEKYRTRKKEKQASGRGVIKDVRSTVWKDYLTGNFKWIDNTFQKNDLDSSEPHSSSAMDDDDINTDSESFTGHHVPDDVDVEDDEWETDDEDDDGSSEEEVVFKKPTIPPSEQRRSKRLKSSNLSMPNIT